MVRETIDNKYILDIRKYIISVKIKEKEKMNILVIGGTRYFGIHMVNKLLEQGHRLTIATRGKTRDSFGDKVERIIIERTNEESMRKALQGKHFDVVIDKIA